MKSLDEIQINGERLWDSLMQMAQIGATPKGGSCRLALTDLDREARDLFIRWAQETGCQVTIDRLGNIFARRSGLRDDLPPVLTGSHLDTQPTGGRFDGVFGVLAGLEMLRTLRETNQTHIRPIEVVVWTNEEGSRFAPGMVPSGVFAGIHTLDEALQLKDADGLTLGDELQRIGYAGQTPVGGRKIHAFFEAHIEQGPILEANDITIGVVTHANGQHWYELTLQGTEAHAGPTPMNRRQDALLGAARIVEMVNALGHQHAPHACATVGMLNVHPNSRNVIPGRTFLTIDIRHPHPETLALLDQTIRTRVEEIAKQSQLEAQLDEIMHFDPLPFEESCVASVELAAEQCGYPHQNIVSGAGHDACNLAKMTPTGMIFIPCIDGISHNETEDAKPTWITAGGNVLLHTVLHKAQD